MTSTDYTISTARGVYFVTDSSKEIVKEVCLSDPEKLLEQLPVWCCNATREDGLRAIVAWCKLHKMGKLSKSGTASKSELSARPLLLHYATHLLNVTCNKKEGKCLDDTWKEALASSGRVTDKREQLFVELLADSERHLGPDNYYFLTSYLSHYPEEKELLTPSPSGYCCVM